MEVTVQKGETNKQTTKKSLKIQYSIETTAVELKALSWTGNIILTWELVERYILALDPSETGNRVLRFVFQQT